MKIVFVVIFALVATEAQSGTLIISIKLMKYFFVGAKLDHRPPSPNLELILYLVSLKSTKMIK
jgi:hypothetical protein